MTTILSKRPILRTVILLVALIGTILLTLAFRPKPPVYALADLARADRPEQDTLTTVIISASAGDTKAESLHVTAATLESALEATIQKVITSPNYSSYTHFRLDVAYGGDAANSVKLIKSLSTTITEHTYFASPDYTPAKIPANPTFTPAQISDFIYKNAQFLANQLDDNGRFVFGVNISTSEPLLSNYTTNEHSLAISALLRAYSLSHDSQFLAKAELALDYLLDFLVTSSANPTQAFIKTSDNTSLDLGATALTAIALSDYQDITGNTKYSDILRALVNGTEEMHTRGGLDFLYTHQLSSSDGTFDILYPTGSLPNSPYDVHATYALLRATKTLNDATLITLAERNLDHIMVDETYITSATYWIVQSIKLYEQSTGSNSAKSYTTPVFRVRTPEELHATYLEPWHAMFSSKPSAVLHSFRSCNDDLTVITSNQYAIFELMEALDSANV